MAVDNQAAIDCSNIYNSSSLKIRGTPRYPARDALRDAKILAVVFSDLRPNFPTWTPACSNRAAIVSHLTRYNFDDGFNGSISVASLGASKPRVFASKNSVKSRP